ncbi:MAG: 2-C-methyl-D-erythritol 4-phosphate cytidylyltransferase [Gammaproteobacteria bacterium]|nr:MAG: 2-C-methyl-D-erythritol 4-phosphate cytidylyltransferase [Gammaproteobacteria bacterium]
MSEQVWAIVPAAGIGSRMKADRPKQYLQLDNKCVIEHTLERLASHPRIKGIVIAIALNDPWWSEISLPSGVEIHIVTGGAQRADSVLNALTELQQFSYQKDWVLVHDAARPCLRHQDIDQMLLQLADSSIGGILGVPVNDTVKRTDSDNQIISTVERKNLWRAATPQMFHVGPLKQALEQAKQQGLNVTDEASAMELFGFQPMMVEGHADNIKITLPHDLALASLFIQQQLGETS